MHEMQTIVTDVCSVCLSRGSARHSVQPLPNHFGLLFIVTLLFTLAPVTQCMKNARAIRTIAL